MHHYYKCTVCGMQPFSYGFVTLSYGFVTLSYRFVTFCVLQNLRRPRGYWAAGERMVALKKIFKKDI